MYDAPIFAIPGNHDGMVWDQKQVSLAAFLDNFCAPVVKHADNAGSLHRTTMNQPGVYFTLEAPFASIVGLYSNTPDKGPGVISNAQSGGAFVGRGAGTEAISGARNQTTGGAASATGKSKAFILAPPPSALQRVGQ